MKIVIYSKPMCPWCVKAKEELKRRHMHYVEHVVGKDLTREELVAILPENVKTVPQIFINDVRIGGYEDLIRWFDKHSDV